MSEILSSPHSSPPGSDTALALRDSFDAFLPPFERKEIHDRLARDVYKLQSDDGGTFDISRANLEDLLQIWAVFRGRLSPLFLINQNKEPLSLETFREDAVVMVNLPSHFSSKGEYQGVSVFSPADVLPGWIAYVESGGILYERKKSPTPPSGEDVAKVFLAGKISAQELLLKKRQESDVFVPVWGAGTPLSLVSGQQIRLIGNTTLEEAKRSGRPLHEAIRGLLRQKQAEAFKD